MPLPVRIQKALLEPLKALRFDVPVPIDWPGESFMPRQGVWMRAGVDLPRPVQVSFGDRAIVRYVGGLLVNVFEDRLEDHYRMLDIAWRVAERFRLGTEIKGEGLTIRILRPPFIAAPVTEPGWVNTPVSIEWTLEVPNLPEDPA